MNVPYGHWHACLLHASTAYSCGYVCRWVCYLCDVLGGLAIHLQSMSWMMTFGHLAWHFSGLWRGCWEIFHSGTCEKHFLHWWLQIVLNRGYFVRTFHSTWKLASCKSNLTSSFPKGCLSHLLSIGIHMQQVWRITRSVGDYFQPVGKAAPASKGDLKSCVLLGAATNPSSVRPETWDNGWILWRPSLTYMYFLYQSQVSGLQIAKHWVYKASWTVLL